MPEGPDGLVPEGRDGLVLEGPQAVMFRLEDLNVWGLGKIDSSEGCS